MKNLPLDPELFVTNRKRFVERMKPNSIAIFHYNPVLPENGDAVYAYKANSDVVWLSGIAQEKTIVILYPGNADKNAREVLVIQRLVFQPGRRMGKPIQPKLLTSLSQCPRMEFVE